MNLNDELTRAKELLQIREPICTSKVDSRGRITIRDDVRKRKDIAPGDYVDVFELEKVSGCEECIVKSEQYSIKKGIAREYLNWKR